MRQSDLKDLVYTYSSKSKTLLDVSKDDFILMVEEMTTFKDQKFLLLQGSATQRAAYSSYLREQAALTEKLLQIAEKDYSIS